MTGKTQVVPLTALADKHDYIKVESVAGGLRIENLSQNTHRVYVSVPASARKWTGHFRLVAYGYIESGSTAGVVFDCGPESSSIIPLNSQTAAPPSGGRGPAVILELGPSTRVLMTRFELALEHGPVDLFGEHFDQQQPENLLISPLYPSSLSEYAATFAHARVRGYQRGGVKVPILVVSYLFRNSSVYEFEGVTVFRATYQQATELLSRYAFKNVLVHFFDEYFATALDRALKLHDTHLVFFCHGAETLFEQLLAEAGPYFAPLRKPDANDHDRFRRRRRVLRKYNKNPNVTWVFMSEWQKQRTEELLGYAFSRAVTINNFIDPAIFPRRERAPDDRKRILFARRYDNEKNYAVDVGVQVVLELSRRDFFDDLEFLFVGDGNYYDALVAPLRGFPNVKLERRFLSHHELSKTHGRFGIYLSPTRFDTQGVAAGEAASSGTVVVTNDVAAVTEFRPRSLGTIANSLDARELADIIERLYREPEWFMSRSVAFSEHTQKQTSYENTIARELDLFQRGIPAPPPLVECEKVLTVCVPTYNMETMLERCVTSLVRVPRPERLDVVVVDDGSKDNSRRLAEALAERWPGVVRVISKANGGHGSAVNSGIEAAKGRYFRILDSDDYVDWVELASVLDRLEKETADVVLTDYIEDWPSYDWLDPMDLYGHLPQYQVLHFDHMVDSNYGFRRWGPLLSTSTYRTQVLRDAGVRLDEHCSYVDMEYNVLALHKVDSLVYYPHAVYIYSQGRATQTVHRSSFIKKHKDHERVILRIADYVDAQLKDEKIRRQYALSLILKPLVFLQYELLGEWIGDKAALERFQKKLTKYSFAKDLVRPVSHRGQAQQPKLSMGEIVKNALPHAFVDGIEPAQLQSANAIKLLKRVGRYFMPHIVVKTLKK